MNDSTPSNDTGRARRLIVTLLIGTAAAAVTAGVALSERHPGEAALERAEAGPTNAGAAAVEPAAPVHTRREQWRDPWKRPAPLSESAPTSIGDETEAVASPTDPSLPPAAEALKGVAGASGENTPTF